MQSVSNCWYSDLGFRSSQLNSFLLKFFFSPFLARKCLSHTFTWFLCNGLFEFTRLFFFILFFFFFSSLCTVRLVNSQKYFRYNRNKKIISVVCRAFPNTVRHNIIRFSGDCLYLLNGFDRNIFEMVALWLYFSFACIVVE